MATCACAHVHIPYPTICMHAHIASTQVAIVGEAAAEGEGGGSVGEALVNSAGKIVRWSDGKMVR